MDNSKCCTSSEPDLVNEWPQVHNMTSMDKPLLAGGMVLRSPNSDISQSLVPSVQKCVEPLDIAMAWLQSETESYMQDMDLLECFRILPPDPEDDRPARKRKIVNEEGKRKRHEKRKRRRIVRDEREPRITRGMKRKAEAATCNKDTVLPRPKRSRIPNANYGCVIGTSEQTQSSPKLTISNLFGNESQPCNDQLPSTSRHQLCVPTIGDGRCFFRAISICSDIDLQLAERDVDGNPKDLRMRFKEMREADVLRSKMIRHMLDNFGLYENLDERLVNADLPSSLSYSSIKDRIASMVNPSEMVGEIEIAATASYLRRPVHVCVGDSTLKFGTEYVESDALVVKYVNLVEDVGHYEALVTRTEPGTDQPELREELSCPSLFSLVTKPDLFSANTRTASSDIVTSSPYQDHLMEKANMPNNSRSTSTAYNPSKGGKLNRNMEASVHTDGSTDQPELREELSCPSLFSLVTKPDLFSANTRTASSDIVTSSPYQDHLMEKENMPNNSRSTSTADNHSKGGKRSRNMAGSAHTKGSTDNSDN